MPKISVIMPVYNAEKHIECSLRCVLEQTFLDMECIIVNDCSSDQTAQIIEQIIAKYSSRKSQVKIINHSENQGVAIARQTGLKTAIGEYIIHIDSDDYCESTMLEQLYAKAKETNADIVVCDYDVVYKKKQERIHQNIPNSGKKCMESLLSGKMHGALWNKLINRNLYVKNNLSFIPKLNMWEDKTMLIRLCFFATNVVHLQQSLYRYNLTNADAITAKLSCQSLQNIKQSVAVIEKFLKQHEVLSQYSDFINYYKLEAKSVLITHSSGKQQKIYSQYYSEANSQICQQPTMALHYKMALWCANYKLLFVSNIIFWLLKIIKEKIRG